MLAEPTPDNIINILLVDDHPTVCETLRLILSTDPSIAIAGEARDGQAAIDLAERVRPDVIIMDIGLPQVNGLAATRRLCCWQPPATVIILTVHEDRYYVLESLKAGATGYVLKRAMSSDILTAISAARKGEPYVSPLMAARLDGELPWQAPHLRPGS